MGSRRKSGGSRRWTVGSRRRSGGSRRKSEDSRWRSSSSKRRSGSSRRRSGGSKRRSGGSKRRSGCPKHEVWTGWQKIIYLTLTNPSPYRDTSVTECVNINGFWYFYSVLVFVGIFILRLDYL